MKNVEIRIGNLKFGKATYLGGKSPAFPAYLIDVVEPNTFYFDFKKGYFEQDPNEKDNYLYVGPDETRKAFTCKYHKSCFKNKESSWAVASFNYNEKEERYDLDFFRWETFIDKQYDSLRNDFWKMLMAISETGIFDPDNIKSDEV